jgi:hypothetical protein
MRGFMTEVIVNARQVGMYKIGEKEGFMLSGVLILFTTPTACEGTACICAGDEGAGACKCFYKRNKTSLAVSQKGSG